MSALACLQVSNEGMGNERDFRKTGVVLLLVVLMFLFTTQNARFIYQSNLVTFLAQATAVQLFSSRRRGFCKCRVRVYVLLQEWRPVKTEAELLRVYLQLSKADLMTV